MTRKEKTSSRPIARSYFDRIRLRNIRCFQDTDVALGPNVTVIIGENGAGKTTVVEALASLTHGADEGLAEFPLRRGASRGEVSLYESRKKRKAASWTTSASEPQGERNTLPQDRYLFAYGRYRRVFFPEQKDAERQHWQPSLDLHELARLAGQRRTVTLNQPDNNLLRDLARYLAALDFGRGSDPRLEQTWRDLNASLKQLGHRLEGIAMEKRPNGSAVPMVVRNGLRLELRELSDGYQALLVVIFDLMLRYAYLFPSLKKPLEGEGLVAIDEVDLHLHPRWQRTAVAQLIDLFPNTQFVLTTHSPAVVQGAIDLKMKVVSLHEKDGEVIAKPLGARKMSDLHGAEIGSLLLDGRLFGVDSRYSVEYSDVEKRVSDLQTRVSAGKATDEERQELFQHLDTLHGLVAKDESRRADGAFMSQMSDVRRALLKDLDAELKKTKS